MTNDYEIIAGISQALKAEYQVVCAAASPGTNHASLGLQVKRMLG